MEPNFVWGQNSFPGEVNLYTYFLDMTADPKDGMYWSNAFFPPGPDHGLAVGKNRVIPPLGASQCWG
jgi:hypothetical protein